MKKVDKLKVLNEIDALEQERKKYGPREKGLSYFFWCKNLNSFRMDGKIITRKEVDLYAKYSNVFIMYPASTDERK